MNKADQAVPIETKVQDVFQCMLSSQTRVHHLSSLLRRKRRSFHLAYHLMEWVHRAMMMTIVLVKRISNVSGEDF